MTSGFGREEKEGGEEDGREQGEEGKGKRKKTTD